MRARSKKAITAILSVTTLAALVFGLMQYSAAAQYRMQLDALYRKSFDELVIDIERLKAAVDKLRIASSAETAVQYLGDIRNHAEHAAGMLGQLPSSPAHSTFTSYFNEFAAYAEKMRGRVMPGGMANEDMRELDGLFSGLSQLHAQLDKLRADDLAGYQALGKEDFFDSLPKPDTGGDSAPAQMPALLFDGPFSQGREARAPRMARERVTVDDALNAAQKALPNMPKLTFVQEAAGDVPAYWFSGQWPDGRIDVQIAKNGGDILRIIEDVPMKEFTPGKFENGRCYDAAKAYLDAHGYDNMQPNYWQHYGSVAVINFASEQDGVLLYPDLIKVWVEMETGRIVGLDTWDYYLSHRPREIPKPTITPEEAARKLSGRLEHAYSRLALIPTAGAQETLCYEYTVLWGAQEYLVYINAMTGGEERILHVIHAPGGQLVQ